MSTSNDDIYGVSPSNFVILQGATLARYINVAAGQKNVTFKMLRGGTLEILSATGYTITAGGTIIPGGSTQTATDLAALNGSGYLVQAEVFSFDGPTAFYLNCIGGNSCLIHMIKGLTP